MGRQPARLLGALGAGLALLVGAYVVLDDAPSPAEVRVVGRESNAASEGPVELTDSPSTRAVRSARTAGIEGRPMGRAPAPFEARAVYAGTDVPIRFVGLTLVDAGGRRVTARTDRDGRIRANGALEAGSVDVVLTDTPGLAPPQEAAGNGPGAVLERPLGNVTVRSSGANDPNLWHLTCPAILPVRVLPSAGTRANAPTFYGQAEPGGPTQSLVGTPFRGTTAGFGGEGAYAIQLDPAPERVGPVPLPPGPWHAIGLGEPLEGRRLHVVVRSEGTPLVGSVDATTLPLVGDPPLEVRLEALTTFDAAELAARFGPGLGSYLAAIAESARRRAELKFGTAWISGTVETQSGVAADPLWIHAQTVDRELSAALGARPGRALVEWTKCADGRHVGSFILEGLAQTDYELRPVGSRLTLFRPAESTARAPAAMSAAEGPTFLLLDEFPTVRLDLEIDLTGALESELEIAWSLEGTCEGNRWVRRGSGRLETRWESRRFVLLRDLPATARFTVRVEVAGYRPLQLPGERFVTGESSAPDEARRVAPIRIHELTPATARTGR